MSFLKFHCIKECYLLFFWQFYVVNFVSSRNLSNIYSSFLLNSLVLSGLKFIKGPKTRSKKSLCWLVFKSGAKSKQKADYSDGQGHARARICPPATLKSKDCFCPCHYFP